MNFDLYFILIGSLCMLAAAVGFFIFMVNYENNHKRKHVIIPIIFAVLGALSFSVDIPVDKSIDGYYNECYWSFNSKFGNNVDSSIKVQNHCYEFAKKRFAEEGKSNGT